MVYTSCVSVCVRVCEYVCGPIEKGFIQFRRIYCNINDVLLNIFVAF